MSKNTRLGARVARLSGASRVRSVNKPSGAKTNTVKTRSLSGKAKGCGCKRK